MRKTLLCTTAMAGAAVLFAGTAVAAEKPKLMMDGFVAFEAWGVSQDLPAGHVNTSTTGTGVGFATDDAEIHFQGSAKADNGLEYGFYVELQEGTTDGSAGYDEANVFLSGNWGRLDLGAQDGAEDNLKVGAVSIMADLDGAWDGKLVFDTLSNTAYLGSNMVGNTGDANKITYSTPTFSGFSAGVSYTPNSGAAMSTAFQAQSQSNEENVFEYGVKYAATVSNVDIEVSARGITGHYGLNDTGSTTTEKENIGAWGAGVKLAYQGFEVAGSYTDNGDSGITKSAKAGGSDAGAWWDIGVAYGAGPYKVSIAYMSSWAKQGTGVSDDTIDYLSIGGIYNAAPGLDFYATYQYVDLDRTGTASDNTVDMFMVGTQVSF